jgi:hypothetical protein
MIENFWEAESQRKSKCVPVTRTAKGPALRRQAPCGLWTTLADRKPLSSAMFAPYGSVSTTRARDKG